ncbi:hypothetical protein DL96DRAFT_1589444 [Flagelloscypha sp. PMI_526]|nr:hypothetical protein DL96DRAFT_1589444 [Flagelloscypha sp. PMI_526]
MQRCRILFLRPSLRRPLSARMSILHKPAIEPLAPMEGSIRFPGPALVVLARSILTDLKAHYTKLGESPPSSDNEDEDAEPVDTPESDDRQWAREDAYHTHNCLERLGEEGSVDVGVEAQKQLLTIGDQTKADYIVKAAADLRRETRGEAPESELGIPLFRKPWWKEDTLLDLLVFLAENPNRACLFEASSP